MIKNFITRTNNKLSLFTLLNKNQNKFSFSVFSNGSKSVISLSRLVINNTHTQPHLNIYLHDNQLQFPINENTIFRLIISPHLSNKDMNLNINELKSHPMMNKVIKIHQDKKFQFNASRIIIDSAIQPTYHNEQTNQKIDQPYKFIKNNMIQIEKLIQIGLNIPLAYMISNKSFNKEFLQLIAKKPKAISSNLALIQGVNFNQVLYDHGYNLQHIFLNSYGKSGKQFSLLEENMGYDLIQFAMILGMISFKGKIILKDDQFYEKNANYLEKVLKKAGYRLQEKIPQKDSNLMEYL